MKNNLLIFIPTFNERENVLKIFHKIYKLFPFASILFIDDNSPDGTGKILSKLSGKYSNLHVIHRPSKLGIGSAHVQAINWAYDKKFKNLITMDCDFTHRPEVISDFIKNSVNFDIVIGSRYIKNDSLKSWNLYRKFLTNLGHFLTKSVLRLPYDATGAFRLYKLDKIERTFLNIIQSNKYAFFFESLFILHRNNFRIKEIPINLPSRVYGHSKMSLNDAINSLFILSYLFLSSIINSEKFYIAQKFKSTLRENIEDPQDWESYWSRKNNNSSFVIYELIAVFYRKFIIKPSLIYFTSRFFKKGSKLLHAGCGSGQVDKEIVNNFKITALDISLEALTLYKKVNKNKCDLIYGSIFSIPRQNKSFSGIYNLGVMEHFTEIEIKKILKEFRRVLKNNGKIILFWPHEYALSVIFLKFVHYVSNNLFQMKLKLHPDEITRIHSKKQAELILKNSGFDLVYYSFCFKDFFTHAVLVGKKN